METESFGPGGGSRIPARIKRDTILRFMEATNATALEPRLFLDWLRVRTDEPLWRLFFGMSDQEAAEKWRINLVRNMASGLRIRIRVSAMPPPARVGMVKQGVESIEAPAFISPMDERHAGSAYRAAEPGSDAYWLSLRLEAAQQLEAVLKRHSATFYAAEIDPARLRRIIEDLRPDNDEEQGMTG